MIVTDLEHFHPKSGEKKIGYYLDRWLKDNLDGIPNYIKKAWDVVGIISGRGKVRIGKALKKGSKILMANGKWINIEDVKIGDKVISPSIDGRKTTSHNTPYWDGIRTILPIPAY